MDSLVVALAAIGFGLSLSTFLSRSTPADLPKPELLSLYSRRSREQDGIRSLSDLHPPAYTRDLNATWYQHTRMDQTEDNILGTHASSSPSYSMASSNDLQTRRLRRNGRELGLPRLYLTTNANSQEEDEARRKMKKVVKVVRAATRIRLQNTIKKAKRDQTLRRLSLPNISIQGAEEEEDSRNDLARRLSNSNSSSDTLVA